jgi:trimeric autotransporter adhesin
MNSYHSRNPQGALTPTWLRNLAPLLILGTCSIQNIYAQAVPPRLYLSAARQFDTSYRGSAHARRAMSGRPSALSMAAGDLDGDAVTDLAVGFAAPGGGLIAIHHGNIDAFAPQSEASFWAIAREEFPAPYLPQADLVEIPARPDFLAVGDLIGAKGSALAAAASGGNSIYVLSRGGSGTMEVLQTLAVPGSITGMDAQRLSAGKFWQLTVGVRTDNGPRLVIYTGSHEGLSETGNFPLTADATAFVSGNLDGDGIPDLLVVGGGQVSILHGGSQTLEPLNVPFTVSAAALGRFLNDRDPLLQIALFATDGSLHIMAQNSFDSTPFTLEELQAKRRAQIAQMRQHLAQPAPAQRTVTWKEVESNPELALPDKAGVSPLMFRTRISDHPADDLMMLGAAKLSVLAHPTSQPSEGNVMDRTDLGVDAVAALPVRVNIDGRPGVVYMERGQTTPRVLMPLPDPTFTVNRTDDPTPPASLSGVCNGVANDCSLREAVLKANATSGTDTIMIPAGTYTLTIPRSASPAYDARTGTLDITDSVNITGAGQNSTIVQAGTQGVRTGSPNGVDKVFSFNQDITAFTDATVSVSNLTIQNGFNRGNENITDGWGGAFDCDTGTNGNASVTLTNVTLNNNTLTQGEGAGFAAFNTNAGTGSVTVTGSLIENNVNQPDASGAGGNGGGIAVEDPAFLTMSSTQVTGNKANSASNTTPAGGGLFIFQSGAVNGVLNSVTLHGVTISNNLAGGEGGGIYSLAGLTIDQGSIISGNTSDLNGGGIWFNNGSAQSLTLSEVNITGNTATGSAPGNPGFGHGGGIRVDDSTTSFTMHFSRLFNNTANGAAAGNNLSVVTGTVNVTENWWASNSTPTIENLGASITSSPWIVLTLAASPTTVKINTTSTLTADVEHDSSGATTGLSGHLAVFPGLPVTFVSGPGGSIITSQPVDFTSSGSVTSTFQAGGSGATVTASAVFDGVTVNANITVLQPPSMTLSFSPTTVKPNTASTLTFSVTNGNTVSIDASFSDSLPTGMQVASTPSINNGCGGTVTATAGATNISFSNTTLAVGTCTIQVNVIGTTDNTFTDSATIDSTAAGNGNTATANLTVASPPSISKSFSPNSIAVGGTSTLTLNITNSNASLALSGVAFTDTLPSGTTVASTPNASNTCGGTVTASGGASSASLAGGTIAGGGSCAVSVSVQGTTAGTKNNSVQVTSTNAGTGNIANASLTVEAPPSISKSFGAGSIAFNASTNLTFTITNPAGNPASLTGVGFTDTLPTGLTVTSVTSSICGGTLTVTAPVTIQLANATVATGTPCTFSVTVTGAASGSYTNTTGNVTSTNGGTGNTASASLTVGSAPTTVTSLSSTAANGTYGTGAVIPITVTFSAAVNVTGTPQISVNSGGIANYTSGSGTTTLTFTYTVGAGQTSAHLDASSSSALTLNGGTIKDSSSANANLTLPVGASPGSLFSNKSIAIDTTVPTVVSYSVLFGSESYNVIGTSRNRLPWQITGIQVVFSKPITAGNVNSLTGLPTTAFAGLGTNRLTWTITPESVGTFATQLAGSGSNTLMDASGNALAGGAGFSQNLKILWGDFNDDGYVNATDMLQVNSAISQTYNIFADMNGDGVVSIADVQLVRSHAGATLP